MVTNARAGPVFGLIFLLFIAGFPATARAYHETRIPQAITDAENLAAAEGVSPEVVKRLKAIGPVIVQIIALDEESNITSGGTGFLVADDLVLSALHVAPPFEELLFSKRLWLQVFINGELIRGYIPDRRYYDVENDLVAIRLVKKVPIEPIPIAKQDPAIGETLYAFGYTNQDRPVLLGFKYVGDTQINESGKRFLVTTRGVDFGYSGGALLNSSGEAAGITVRISGGTAFSYSIPWDVVRNFLSQIPNFKFR